MTKSCHTRLNRDECAGTPRPLSLTWIGGYCTIAENVHNLSTIGGRKKRKRQGRKGIGPLSRRNQQDVWRAAVVVSVIGLDLAVFFLLGVALGRWLDRMFHTAPLFLIAGILAGLAGWVLSLLPLVKRLVGDDHER